MDQYAALDTAGATASDSFLSGSQKRVLPRPRFWLEFSVVAGDGRRGRDSGRDGGPVFHPFGRLPAELRIQIWTLAACTPRIVAIACRSADVPPRRPGTPVWRPPAAPLPVLMRVSREACAVARRVYARAFRWQVPHTLLLDEEDEEDEEDEHGDDLGRGGGRGGRSQRRRRRPGGAGCWFNFASDAVLLCGELEPSREAASTSMVYFLPRPDAARVRLVACNARDLGVGDLLANQLYARLFPVIDRFAIQDELVVAVPAGDGPAPGGQHPPRKTLTEASLLAAAGDDSGRGCDDVNNNICQQVWDRWTNSQNMPRMGVAGRGALSGAGSAARTQNTPPTAMGVAQQQMPARDSTEHAPETFPSTLRIHMVAERDLLTAMERLGPGGAGKWEQFLF